MIVWQERCQYEEEIAAGLDRYATVDRYREDTNNFDYSQEPREKCDDLLSNSRNWPIP
jgi:hypothetical protein